MKPIPLALVAAARGVAYDLSRAKARSLRLRPPARPRHDPQENSHHGSRCEIRV